MLTRDQILAADDVRKEEVEVPEWGGSVYVRGPTGRFRDEFEAAVVGAGDDIGARMANIRARFAANSICDETGALLFSAQDVEALGEKSAAALDRVFSVAQRLAGLTAEDIEELEGN